MSADAAEHIQIWHREDSLILERIESRWYLTSPFHARADETKIEKILEILSSKSHHRLPLSDLDSFGLDKPNIQLQINHEKFSFGGLTPITNEQYVAVGESIYLLSPRYSVMLPSQSLNIASTSLLDKTEVPVGLELRDLGVDSSEFEPLFSKGEKGGWVQLWQTSSAAHVYFSADELLGEAQKEIRIILQNGLYIDFKVHQNETELILLRVDEGIGYLFSNELGEQLLDFSDDNPT